MEITDYEVVQNSDKRYKSDVEWFSDIKWQEPNEKEIEMLKGTLSPPKLLEIEKLDIVPETSDKIKRRKIITKVKVIALDKMKESPLCNSSYFSRTKKDELIKHMEVALELYNTNETEFDNVFNEICNKSIFTGDYSNMPIYGC